MKKLLLIPLILITQHIFCQSAGYYNRLSVKNTIGANDSSNSVPNTRWIKSLLYAKKASNTMFPQYSVPFADAAGLLLSMADFTYNSGTATLNVGNSGFGSSSYININGNRGVIDASGYGLTFTTNGGTPVDPSKHFKFVNNNYLYSDQYTTGSSYATWEHWYDLNVQHFRVRKLSADSTALTNTGTTHMLTVDANGQFNHQAIPGGGGGSGTVNSGTINTLAYYAAAGTAVSNLATITANRAIVSDANGLPTASTVGVTELNYISSLSSNAQTQIGSKANLTGGNTLTGIQVIQARVDINTTTGTLRMPRLTTTQQTALTPATGDVIWNTDSSGLVVYNGSVWLKQTNTSTISGPVLSYDAGARILSTRQTALDSLTDLRIVASGSSNNRKWANNPVTLTDANFTATPGSSYVLPASTLTAERVIDLSSITTSMDAIDITVYAQPFGYTFTGGSILFNDGTALKSFFIGATYKIQRLANGQIKIIN